MLSIIEPDSKFSIYAYKKTCKFITPYFSLGDEQVTIVLSLFRLKGIF